MGSFIHAVEDEMLCSSLMPDKVPYFNAPIYLQNKSVIGKVDEILGPINEVYFSVKMGDGMVAGSFKKGDKVYIAGDKLLPIERFLPKPKMAGGMLFPSIQVDTMLKSEQESQVRIDLHPIPLSAGNIFDRKRQGRQGRRGRAWSRGGRRAWRPSGSGRRPGRFWR
jgi:H/ACA ribonucleoprotein complex subunit 1